MRLSYISYFLPIILIFSSIKFFGYVLGFLFFMPFVIKKRGKIFDHIQKLSPKNKLVLYYFYFQIIQTFIGFLVLKDIRILIYWIPFYLVCAYTYYSNSINIIRDYFYKRNIDKILYFSSLLYFILYFILNIFSYFKFGNAYQIQDNLWMGSTAAFSLSSIFLLSIFNLWRKQSFKLNSKYNYSFLFFLLISNINDSRLASIYIICFIFLITINHIKIRKIFSIIILISLYLSFYQASSFFVGALNNYKNWKFKGYDYSNYFSQGSSSLFSTLKDSSRVFIKESKSFITQDNSEKLSRDSTRFLSLIIAKEKFQRSNLYVKLFGTGWYSSRELVSDINSEFADKYAQKYKDCGTCIIKSNVVQLQGIVAIFLDTGITGIILTFTLFFITAKNILFQKSELSLKLFCICLLCIHFLCLFIGYPLNNIIYVLIYMPKGLLNYDYERN